MFWATILTIHGRLGDDKFGILLECIGFNWQALSATDYWATDYPHFKVIVESRAIGDNRLLRGEVMTITDIMATRLREKPLRPHIIAPVRPPLLGLPSSFGVSCSFNLERYWSSLP